MSVKLKSILYVGLDEDQKKDLRADFISAQVLRKRLIKIMEDKIDTKRTSVRNDQNYDKPNWENYVADGIGYERAMYEIISLITSDENNS